MRAYIPTLHVDAMQCLTSCHGLLMPQFFCLIYTHSSNHPVLNSTPSLALTNSSPRDAEWRTTTNTTITPQGTDPLKRRTSTITLCRVGPTINVAPRAHARSSACGGRSGLPAECGLTFAPPGWGLFGGEYGFESTGGPSLG